MWNYTPSMDVYETEKELVIEVELPEVDRKEVKITLEGNTLTIEGVKGYRVHGEKVRFLRLERYSGYFRRKVHLPFIPSEQEIKATMKRGVLKISVKKSTKKIEVED